MGQGLSIFLFLLWSVEGDEPREWSQQINPAASMPFVPF